MRIVAKLAVLFLAVGCAPGARSQSATVKAPDAAGAAAPLDDSLVGFHFADPAEERLHVALRAWIMQRSEGFRFRPRALSGNFVGERWCRGGGDPACDGGAILRSDERGVSWRGLESLTYTTPERELFGTLLSYGHMPAEGPLGLRVWLTDTSKWPDQRIMGDSFTLTFVRLGSERGVEELHTGHATGMSRQVGGWPQHTVSVAAPASWRDTLRALAGSPESLAKFVLAQEEQLLAEGLAELADGRRLGYDEGPYEGRGIPPEQTPRPLTAAERATITAELQAEHARRRAFVTTNAAAMHAMLVEQVPVAILLGAP